MTMLSEAELRAIPKVELHLHLDCSMSFASVSALDPSVTPERYRAEFRAAQMHKPRRLFPLSGAATGVAAEPAGADCVDHRPHAPAP